MEIDHGNGIISTYNHLESTAVEQGESVKVGEVIAHVGTTGSSTGCHLHFETLVKGIHTDPANWELLPVSQLDQLDDLPRNRFEPGLGSKADRAPVWAIPANKPTNREISGGELEAPASKPPASSDKEPGTAPPTGTETPSGGSPTFPTRPTSPATATDPPPPVTTDPPPPVTTDPPPPVTTDAPPPPVTTDAPPPVTTDPPPPVTTDPPPPVTTDPPSPVTTDAPPVAVTTEPPAAGSSSAPTAAKDPA